MGLAHPVQPCSRLVADLGSGTELKAQAMQGRTRMGYAEPERRWVDNRFRSAFVMLTRPFGKFGLAARARRVRHA